MGGERGVYCVVTKYWSWPESQTIPAVDRVKPFSTTVGEIKPWSKLKKLISPTITKKIPLMRKIYNL